MALEETLHLRVSKALMAQLIAIAEAEGRSIGDVVRRLLAAHLAEQRDA